MVKCNRICFHEIVWGLRMSKKEQIVIELKGARSIDLKITPSKEKLQEVVKSWAGRLTTS